MKKAVLSPLTIVWQTNLQLEAVVCLIPFSNLTGLLVVNGNVRMPMLEWEGRVLPARKLAEFVPVSDT